MFVIPRKKPAAVAACICFTASIFITLSPAHSQWIENGVPVCTAPYVQEDPAIVSDGAGGAIIVWSHINTQRDIFAQRLDGDGIALWTVNGVAVCAASGEQLDPAIASDGAGGAIIVWEDNRSTNTIIFESNPVSVPAMPVTLFHNTPNPFNPATTIRYYLPDRIYVTIGVYDIAGRLVDILEKGEMPGGYHETVWSAGGIGSGVYFCRLTAGKVSISHKMVLLK